MLVSRTPLGDESLAELAATLPTWSVQADRLRRELVFPDFAAAFGCLTQIALIAERMDHHPDIELRYDQLILELSTHDAGGVTEWDAKLASQIEGLLTT